MKKFVMILTCILLVSVSFTACSEKPPKDLEGGSKYTLDRLSIYIPKDYEVKEIVDTESPVSQTKTYTAYHKNYPSSPNNIIFGVTEKQNANDYSKSSFENYLTLSFDSYNLISYTTTKISGYQAIVAEYECSYENVYMLQKQYMIFTEDQSYLVITSILNDNINEFDKSLETLKIR